MSEEKLRSEAIWRGITDYIKTLHAVGAVNEAKMRLAAYLPLEKCMENWGIEPHPKREFRSDVDPLVDAAPELLKLAEQVAAEFYNAPAGSPQRRLHTIAAGIIVNLADSKREGA